MTNSVKISSEFLREKEIYRLFHFTFCVSEETNAHELELSKVVNPQMLAETKNNFGKVE